jgi:hypothetical protein
MQGDIVLNQSFLSTPNAFVSGHLGYTTLEHEIGHALGLGDPPQGVVPSADTIMAEAPLNFQNPVRDYTAADKLALQALYGATGSIVIPSPTSVVGTPPPDSSTTGGAPTLDDSHTAANGPVTATSALSNLAASSSLLVQAMASFAAPSSTGTGSLLSTALNEQPHSLLAPNLHHG